MPWIGTPSVSVAASGPPALPTNHAATGSPIAEIPAAVTARRLAPMSSRYREQVGNRDCRAPETERARDTRPVS